jgi:hypothetical protein
MRSSRPNPCTAAMNSIPLLITASLIVTVAPASAAPSAACEGCEATIVQNASILIFGDGTQLMNLISSPADGSCLGQLPSGCVDGSPCTYFHQWSWTQGSCGSGSGTAGYRYWDIDNPAGNHGVTDTISGSGSGSNSGWLACNSQFESIVKVTTACDPPQTGSAPASIHCSDCVDQ